MSQTNAKIDAHNIAVDSRKLLMFPNSTGSEPRIFDDKSSDSVNFGGGYSLVKHQTLTNVSALVPFPLPKLDMRPKLVGKPSVIVLLLKSSVPAQARAIKLADKRRNNVVIHQHIRKLTQSLI